VAVAAVLRVIQARVGPRQRLRVRRLPPQEQAEERAC
jgi:hypothetical protein